MTIATDLWRLSATELADAIRTSQVSSRDVVEAHLRRIEAVNPSVNAVTALLADRAINAAEAADRATARGGARPPLHGVPFTAKENIDLAGTATTLGLAALAGADPRRDAPVVERLRAAGAIPIGHTNMPTLGVRWHCDSELYGATVNPWDPSRTPGASSGGEAAALATGMSPLGLGNDLLGSLRWPAQCCGVCTLRPTLGRIPHATTIEPVDAPISVQLMLVEGRRVGQHVDAGTVQPEQPGLAVVDRWRGDRGLQTRRHRRTGIAARPGQPFRICHCTSLDASRWVSHCLTAGTAGPKVPVSRPQIPTIPLLGRGRPLVRGPRTLTGLVGHAAVRLGRPQH
jgi:hypothetical protein